MRWGMKIRTTKTKSGAAAVQVVRSEYGKTIILHHVGSGNTVEEVSRLKQQAVLWLASYSRQQSFFSVSSSFDPLFSRYQYVGNRYTLLYATLRQVIDRIGFSALDNPLLFDLVLMRVIEPTSKLQSVALLSQYFNIHYDISSVYKQLKHIALLQDAVSSLLISFAKTHLHFDFSFVLYDVTTLYFESFTPDELRACGFSKDNKSNQPQIVVGLLVTSDGFPLSYNVFPGNTFEGHTMIPIITTLVKKYAIKSLTVIADSAMLSDANIASLEEESIHYIVGARLGYLSLSRVQDIVANLKNIDRASIRIPYKNSSLICDFSSKRYAKDKYETEKYIQKARDIIEKKAIVKRHKFLLGKQGELVINQPLIDRTTLLWGIKGYATDLDIPNDDIITKYHSLWNVEKSFRMTKSDLLARPIYHFKTTSITAHLLICVMALAVGKYFELTSKQTLRTILEKLKRVPDARIVDKETKEEAWWRAEIPGDTKELLEILKITY